MVTLAWALLFFGTLLFGGWLQLQYAAVWLACGWEGALMYRGPAQSLRHDPQARQAVEVADMLRAAVPSHVAWIRVRVRRRRLSAPAWVPCLVTCSLIALSPLIGHLTDPSAGWGAFMLGCFGQLVMWDEVVTARSNYVDGYDRRVHRLLMARGPAGLRADRERLALEIAGLEHELDDKRAQLDALEQGIGVDKLPAEIIIDAMKRHMDTQGQQAERRGRRWDLRLALLSLIPGALLGYLVAVFGKSLFGV